MGDSYWTMASASVITALTSVGWYPATVPNQPPISAPTGTIMKIRNRRAAVNRPSQGNDLMLWRGSAFASYTTEAPNSVFMTRAVGGTGSVLAEQA